MEGALRETSSAVAAANITARFHGTGAQISGNATLLRHRITQHGQDTASKSTRKGGKAVTNTVGVSNVVGNLHSGQAGATPGVEAPAHIVGAFTLFLLEFGHGVEGY